MKPPKETIRGRTRWLIVSPLAVLTAIVIGVVALEAAAPWTPPFGREIPGVPAPALDGERACVRMVDNAIAREIRDSLPEGGRVRSSQVYQCPSAFDGADVAFAGEVVGELLPRRGGVWAQVNDDDYALEVGPMIDHRDQRGFNQGMSVWLPDPLHGQIEHPGRADRRGDVILVRGTLLQADPDDGGGITIRAEELEVLAPSLELEAPLHTLQIVVAGVLALVAVATTVWSRRVASR